MEITSKKLVVFDLGPGYDESYLDRENQKDKRFNWPLCYLRERLESGGFRVLTSKTYLSLNEKPKAILLSLLTSHAKELLKNGCRPAILMSLETPQFACKFYFSLKKYSSWFDNTMIFAGAKDILSSRTKYYPMYFPQSYPQGSAIPSGFSGRKYLALINSNLRFRKIRRVCFIVTQWLRPTPGLVNRELYKMRLDAITFFSQREGFDLYGWGWEKPVRYGNVSYSEHIKKSYRGVSADKYETLKNYKFSIVFENTIFPGYVTEKIFDAMFAGCVPVYFGAPDIENFIPSDCFIDFRKFGDFESLDVYLRSMSEKRYEEYVAAIQEFAASARYRLFTQEYFSETIVQILSHYK